jgi:hypothetical protein
MLLLLLTVFPFVRGPWAARASARRDPPPRHASRRGHKMSGHCRRRLRSAWTVRTPHRQTRQGPWWWPAPHSLRPEGSRPRRTARRARAGLQARTVRPAVAPRNTRSRDTLRRPDDARKNCLLSASARSTLGVIPGAGLQRKHPGPPDIPGAQGLVRSVAVSGSKPRWPLGRLPPALLLRGTGVRPCPQSVRALADLTAPARPPPAAARR